jgi:hypothetical protein
MRNLERIVQNTHAGQAYPMWVGIKKIKLKFYNLQSYLEVEAKQRIQT